VGEQAPFVAHRLGQGGQLAAGRGAKIKNALAGLRPQFAHRQQGAGVLHVKHPLLKAGQPAQRRMRAQLENQVFRQPIPADQAILHLLGAPLGKKPVRVGLQRVDPGKDPRRRVVPVHQLCRRLRPPTLPPARHQPFRMRIPKMRLPGFQLRQQAPGGLLLAQITAQDRIDEPGLGVQAAGPGQRDGLVDGRMGRDAFEPENLVKPQPQQGAQSGLELAGIRLARDQPIQRRLPADDTISQLLAKMTVGGRQPPSGQRRGQPILNKISPGLPLQKAQSYFSWFFRAHFV